MHQPVGTVAPPTRTPRAQWIEQGLEALAAGGPDAVRIETLAQSLNVSKGGFYWHFQGRHALLEEMLDTWERREHRRGGGARRERGRRPPDEGAAGRRVHVLQGLLAIDLAVREWSRRDPAVAERLRRVDERRMDYLRVQIAALRPEAHDIEARCLLAFSLAIGSDLINAGHVTLDRSEVLELALTRILAP